MAKMEYLYIHKPLHSLHCIIKRLNFIVAVIANSGAQRRRGSNPVLMWQKRMDCRVATSKWSASRNDKNYIKYSYPLSVLFISLAIPCFALSAENPPAKQHTQEVRPFNNMLRSMILLADEVLSDPKVNPSANANQTTTTTTPPAQNQAPATNTTTPPVTTPIVIPTIPGTGLSTTTPPIIAPDTNTPPPATEPKPEVKTPPQELPKVEMPSPEVPEVKSLPTTSITAPKEGGPGFFGKMFNSSPEEPAPAAPVVRKKKKPEETPKPYEPPPPEPVPGALKPGENPVPNARPDTNYKTQILPSSISKKTYARENEHLPPVVYNEEYKKILFDSAASGDLNLLRTMVDNFKDTEIRDADGNTPLIYATMAGNLESVISLISMGASVNSRNHNGISPLYAATKLGRIDLVMYLLQRTEEPDITDKNDKTPLMLAAEMDLSRITTMLIKSGADIHKKMRNGDTPIHLAASANSVAAMAILLAKGADMEKRNFKGYTPLMIAAEEGQDKAVALLLNAGADMGKTNVQGKDVISIAKNSVNNSTVQLLESERIKRDMLAEKLIETRKTQIITDDIAPIGSTVSPKATRMNGVPLPIFKIKYIPKTKAKEKTKTTSKDKTKGKTPPKPYFSPEEMSKMKKSGG